MAAKILPSQAYLRERFDYDPDTGVVTWRIRPPIHFKNTHDCAAWNTRFAGTPAGWLIAAGYLAVCLDYQALRLHRVIFKWMTGEDPLHEVDHIDGDPCNNRWANLRPATHAENGRNLRTRQDSRLRIKRIWQHPNGRFRAKIMLNGKEIHLGYFPTAEAAKAAYDKAAAELFGEFHRS